MMEKELVVPYEHYEKVCAENRELKKENYRLNQTITPAKIRKETAKEWVNELFSYIGKNQKFLIVDEEPQTWIDVLKLWEYIVELAKQYGVEVEQ